MGYRCTIDGLNAEDLGRPVRRSEMGILPITTDVEDAPAEIRTTHQAIATLNNDVKASTVPEAWKENWYNFAREWLQWIGDIKRLSVYSAPLYAKNVEYRKRLTDYYESFKRAGGKPTVAPPKPPAPPKTPAGMVDAVVSGGVTIALVLGGAMILGSVIRR